MTAPMGPTSARPHEPSPNATLVVPLDEPTLASLHALAVLDGIAYDDPARFSRLATTALRAGVASQLDAAGLRWDPSSEEIEEAIRMEREAGLLDPNEGEPPTDGPASRERGPMALLGGPRRHPLRWGLVGALAVSLVVVLIGGYAAAWQWTGFQKNGQLWDWLNLLLLPVAFGLVPLWLNYRRQMRTPHKTVLLLGIVAFGTLALAGYLAPLNWTGFPPQTLWTWLTLIVLPVSLTAVRLWPTSFRDLRRVHVVAATSLLVGWGATLIGGYAGGWTWTGFQGNTLWDWLQLLLAPVVINTLVVPSVIRFASGDVEGRAVEEERAERRQRLLEAARQRAGVSFVDPPTES